MREVRRNALVPHTAAQMYAIVNDIESYPQFLPWCAAATVRDRTPTAVNGTLELARAGVKVHVSSVNHMVPDRRIDMVQAGGPLKSLSGSWNFVPIEKDGVERGCRVELEVHFEFRNAALTLLFGPLFEHTWDSLVEAFVKRARAVYAPVARG
jgi:ribosome-associated toxin RatA of RatAB toxin-antitoxin module